MPSAIYRLQFDRIWAVSNEFVLIEIEFVQIAKFICLDLINLK